MGWLKFCKKPLDICTDIMYYMCTDKIRQVKRMCPKGRPTQDKRDKRFEMRLSAETYKTLEECAKSLSITKSDVVHKGIALVKAELDKKK